MKIELQVDGHQLTQEVKELVGNLTQEQKISLATGVLSQAFAEYRKDLDLANMEQIALEHVRKSRSRPELTESQAKEYYEWRESLEKQRTVKKELVSAVVKEVVDEARKLIGETIKEDPQVQAVISQCLEEVKKEFPNYIKNAMTMFLIQSTQRAMEQSEAALLKSSSNAQRTDNLINQLTNKGY